MDGIVQTFEKFRELSALFGRDDDHALTFVWFSDVGADFGVSFCAMIGTRADWLDVLDGGGRKPLVVIGRYKAQKSARRSELSAQSSAAQQFLMQLESAYNEKFSRTLIAYFFDDYKGWQFKQLRGFQKRGLRYSSESYHGNWAPLKAAKVLCELTFNPL